ncbi:MAG: Gfo/Idh/MocA family oxidoreductase [Acidobacteriia bacterium]|nr:Gfo/Idh/MocA family oxidoreductase [Terriglobia bacterium]
MTKKIKAGVIGVGYLGRFHAEKYAALPDVELVGVADLDPDRAQEVAGPLHTRAFTDYLQLLLELGAIGFALAVLLGWCVVRQAVRALAMKPAGDNRYMGLASMGALTAISIHSFTDFNLYIPANAMLLAWIAGLIAGLEFLPRRQHNWKQVGVAKHIDVRPVRL